MLPNQRAARNAGRAALFELKCNYFATTSKMDLNYLLETHASNDPLERCRAKPRQSALSKAVIEFSGAATSCTVWNVSEIGACIGIICQRTIPDHFNLIIPRDRSRHTCRVIWRKHKQSRISIRLGVAFQ
jgi:hypothetical protein